MISLGVEWIYPQDFSTIKHAFIRNFHFKVDKYIIVLK